MNVDEWNTAIFREAVQKPGRPGDSLFLYVDEDTLAAATGNVLSPSEAVEDFCRAFNVLRPSLQLQRAAHRALLWERDGMKGEPPFVYALAMTVLAVAMPAIGHSSNVYARQRQLLGLADLSDGIPPGYADHVPTMWDLWNKWLKSEGAAYGAPTAHPGARSYQGWARSQSFIRSVDKEDVLAYFETVDPADTPSEADLLDGIREWLQSQPQLNPRLRGRLEDSELSDEFRAFLGSAWETWSRDQGIIRRHLELVARLYWSDEDHRFDLIVDPIDARPLVGREYALLDGSTESLPSLERPFYLTPESANVLDWLGEPIYGWSLSEGIVVNRFETDAVLLQSQPYFGWIEPRDFEPGRRSMVVYRESLRNEVEELGIRGGESLELIPGWVVLRDAVLDEADPDHLRSTFGLAGVKSRLRSSRLIGGLPLEKGHIFLEQGEPDVLIDDPISVRKVSLNGRDVTESLELVPAKGAPAGNDGSSTTEFQSRLRVVELYLDPGRHSVSIERVTGAIHRHDFESVPPRLLKGRSEGDLKASASEWSGTTQKPPPSDCRSIPVVDNDAFVASEDGEIVKSIRMGQGLPDWLAEVGVPPHMAGSRLLELAEVESPNGKPSVVITRSRHSPHETWRVTALCHPAAERTSKYQLAPLEPGSHISAFLVVGDDQIVADERINLRHLRQGIWNHHFRDPERWRRPTAIREQPVPGRQRSNRRNFVVGRAGENPYNDLLEWLSERSSGRVSVKRASEAFTWLWERYALQSEPDFADVARDLESLGHAMVDRKRQQLWIIPTVMHALPNASAFRVLSGARSELLIAALESGEAEWVTEPTIDKLLMNMIVQPVSPRSHGDPIAPDTIFVQRATVTQQEVDTIRELGIEPLGILGPAFLMTEPDLPSILENATSLELDPRAHVSVWIPGRNHTNSYGRWRTSQQHESLAYAFVKIVQGRHRLYAGWTKERGYLELGWAAGRWWYESFAGSQRPPVLFHAADSRLLIAEDMPLTRTLRRALVAHSGLLARSGRIRPDGARYTVFENIPVESARRVARILGQHSIDETRLSQPLIFDDLQGRTQE